MKHTPTPWEYFEERGHYLITRNYPKQEGKFIVINDQAFDNEADVHRIVECVNLFHGIKNPTKYLRELQDKAFMYDGLTK